MGSPRAAAPARKGWPSGATTLPSARQRALARDGERARHDRRAWTRLPAADADPIAPRAHEVDAVDAHLAQLAVVEREPHRLPLAWLQVNAREAAQRTQRGAGQSGERQVDLHDLVALALARVRDLGFDLHWLARGDRHRNLEVGVGERG